ncbi:MAG: hypothetical protein ACFBSE_12330 [Prochloraceae cyanobacterium]
MIDKLIFQELTDAEAANLTGGVTVQTFTPDGEGGFVGTALAPDGVTVLEFEAEAPEAPEAEDQIAPAPAPTPVAVV